VFVPLLLFFFINACFNSQFLGYLCCEFGCLFIATGWDGLYAQFPLFGLLCIHSMSEFFPRSPLVISSKSDGSSDHIQDIVSSFDPNAQPPHPTLVDGVRSHHPSQPDEPSRPTFADAIKFGLGSHGGSLNPTLEPKPSIQPRSDEHTRVLLTGESSNPAIGLPSVTHSSTYSQPSVNMEEFYACCLLAKVWRESCWVVLLSFFEPLLVAVSGIRHALMPANLSGPALVGCLLQGSKFIGFLLGWFSLL